MPISDKAVLFSTVMLAACGTSGTRGPQAPSTVAVQSIVLPGAPPTGGVFMDYLAIDRPRHRVWVPAGNTGKVDVVDTTNGQVSSVDGFATAEFERNGRKRIVGPSSAAVGEGVVYVGNRGDTSVCAVEAESLKKGVCTKLDGMPDGIAWVGATKEVWVTTPRTQSIVVLDASTPDALPVKTTFKLDGAPEGFAVDDARGLVYTNLEDKDKTLALDAKNHTVATTWQPGCGEDGPKGLALDHALNFLFVACSDKVKVLDAGHQGRELSKIETGDGVDNIDYVEARKELFAGASRAARLTVATVDAQGKLSAKSVVATAKGARNPVATDEGAAYLTDSPEGKLLVVPAANR